MVEKPHISASTVEGQLRQIIAYLERQAVQTNMEDKAMKERIAKLESEVKTLKE
ncbi:MAG: hypothetical protein IJE00_01250 [Clostridia bacterium]|nr:hypothetical protein [Clostridia bacterium]